MEACNHATFSQAILKSLGDVEISYHQVHAVVTDSAAYCKKAFKDVLSAVLSNSTHVLCIAHIVNLASDVFQKHEHFHHMGTPIMMIKSSFFKKPGRKARFLSFSLTQLLQLMSNFRQYQFQHVGTCGLRQHYIIPAVFTHMRAFIKLKKVIQLICICNINQFVYCE